MADSPLPAAGWYADGSTLGVRRWFDGADWTEHTRPEPAPAPVPQPWAPESRFSTTSTAPPSRLDLTTSTADHADREAAFLRHRIADARRVRRSSVGEFVSALVLLLVTGGVSLALGAPDELWLVGGLGALFLVGRAIRDYHRAVFRGAPRFPLLAWVPAVVGLSLALGVFVAVPVEAAHHVSQEIDDVPDLSKIPDLSGLSGLGGLGG